MVGKAFKGAGQLLYTAANMVARRHFRPNQGPGMGQYITQQQADHGVVNVIPPITTPSGRIVRVQAMAVPNLRRTNFN